MEELYNQVYKRFAEYHDPAHDVLHVLRVSNLAKQIAKAEDYDETEAELAGLLHDIGRTVKNRQEPHAHAGVPIARELLNTYTDLSEEAKEKIVTAIKHHSDKYTDGKLNNILQDADKLDGMGAIGIARAYTSLPDSPAYDPNDILPKNVVYGNVQNAHEIISLVMQFNNMLYTEKAKELGKPRYEFMKGFMDQVLKEIKESS